MHTLLWIWTYLRIPLVLAHAYIQSIRSWFRYRLIRGTPQINSVSSLSSANHTLPSHFHFHCSGLPKACVGEVNSTTEIEHLNRKYQHLHLYLHLHTYASTQVVWRTLTNLRTTFIYVKLVITFIIIEFVLMVQRHILRGVGVGRGGQGRQGERGRFWAV